MPPLFPATVALYGIACALFFAHLYGPYYSPYYSPQHSPQHSPQQGQRQQAATGVSSLARIALALAFASHAVDIGWLCTKGMHPVVDAKEALSFFSWLLCGAYLVLSSRYRLAAIGVVLVPMTLVLDLAARLSPGNGARSAVSLLAIVHITLASLGVALFAVAACGAVLYLVEERNLKQHRAGRLFRRGPALETLDTLNRRATAVGFTLFTVALITGAVWLLQTPGGDGLLSAQYLLSSVAWLVYAGLIAARIGVGFRGRRAAVLTVAGALTAVAVLVVYLVRGGRGA
ncbi:MAG: cytochrome c biogenesis protein CcsA [Polyangia bacterium]